MIFYLFRCKLCDLFGCRLYVAYLFIPIKIVWPKYKLIKKWPGWTKWVAPLGALPMECRIWGGRLCTWPPKRTKDEHILRLFESACWSCPNYGLFFSLTEIHMSSLVYKSQPVAPWNSISPFSWLAAIVILILSTKESM